MTDAIRDAIRRVADFSGANSILRRMKVGPIVLFYHGIEEEIVDERVQTLHLPFHAFEKQIKYLRRYFDIVSLDDFFDVVSREKKVDPAQVVLTFDDGYENNGRIVAPYLAAEGIPFSVFVSTRHVAEGIRFPTYYLRASIYYTRQKHARILDKEFDIGSDAKKRMAIDAISAKLKRSPQETTDRIVGELVALVSESQWLEVNELFSSDQPMNWDDVKELHNRGVTIGSHCHDHCILHERQAAEEIDRQLQVSKALIQQHTGECKYVAYPNGGMRDVSADALKRARGNRYLAGFTTIAGEIEPEGSPYLVPRIGGEIADIYRFRFAVNSSFRYNEKYRQWARSLMGGSEER